MERLSFIRSLMALTRKGSTDTELSEELTAAYFGDENYWDSEAPANTQMKREDLLSGAD